MKYAKKVLALLLVLCCSAGVIVPAFATAVEPFSVGTTNANSTLSIDSGGTATCNIFVRAKDPEQYVEITTTLYRMRGNTDLPEMRITSWTTEKKFTVLDVQTIQVNKGYKYQLWSNVIIKDSGGRQIESFWIYSDIC